MRKKLFLFITMSFFVFLSITSVKTCETLNLKKTSFSYLLSIGDKKENYSITVKEYEDNTGYYRRDDWTDKNHGSLSYITIKEESKNILSYFIVHEQKKVFQIYPDSKGNLEEIWISNINSEEIEKEVMPDEMMEGYLCKKYKFIDDNKKCILWFSPELNKALKIDSTLPDFIFNLKITEINTDDLDKSIFNIPEDYEVITVKSEDVELLPVY